MPKNESWISLQNDQRVHQCTMKLSYPGARGGEEPLNLNISVPNKTEINAIIKDPTQLASILRRFVVAGQAKWGDHKMKEALDAVSD